MAEHQLRALAHYYAVLDRCAQFPDVPRPRKRRQHVHHFGSYLAHILAVLFGEFLQEGRSQHRNIALRANRRHDQDAAKNQHRHNKRAHHQDFVRIAQRYFFALGKNS